MRRKINLEGLGPFVRQGDIKQDDKLDPDLFVKLHRAAGCLDTPQITEVAIGGVVPKQRFDAKGNEMMILAMRVKCNGSGEYPHSPVKSRPFIRFYGFDFSV